MPNYRWSCLACGTGNAAELQQCTRCGCPANPRYKQVVEAKSAAGIQDEPDGPTARELFGAFVDYAKGRRAGDQPFLVAFAFEIGLCLVGGAVVLLLAKACSVV